MKHTSMEMSSLVHSTDRNFFIVSGSKYFIARLNFFVSIMFIRPTIMNESQERAQIHQHHIASQIQFAALHT